MVGSFVVSRPREKRKEWIFVIVLRPSCGLHIRLFRVGECDMSEVLMGYGYRNMVGSFVVSGQRE